LTIISYQFFFLCRADMTILQNVLRFASVKCHKRIRWST